MLQTLDVGLNHSKCRAFPLLHTAGNDPDRHRPWCFYKRDLQWEWGYCHPLCNPSLTCLTAGDEAVSYTGFRNSTMSGRTCREWRANKNKWPVWDSDGNYCRNKGQLPGGPWCFTTDPEVTAEPCFPQCQDEESEPSCIGEDNMANYAATKRTTATGRSCQRWDQGFSVIHNFTGHHFQVQHLWEVSNFCRNPTGESQGPWCFTDNGTAEREFCFEACHWMTSYEVCIMYCYVV